MRILNRERPIGRLRTPVVSFTGGTTLVGTISLATCVRGTIPSQATAVLFLFEMNIETLRVSLKHEALKREQLQKGVLLQNMRKYYGSFAAFRGTVWVKKLVVMKSYYNRDCGPHASGRIVGHEQGSGCRRPPLW